MSRRLRWGLIGASDIAATRVLPALRALGDEAASVYSAAPERGRAYAAAHGLPRAAGSLGELLDDRIDAVYVSTTNELHCEQVLAAARAGRHVLCEKPLALSMQDAWRMISACREADVVLAVNHHLPAAGTHRKVAELVRDGAVGAPLAMRIFHAGSLPERLRGWRLSAPERGAGVLLDTTVHDASVANAVLGRRALEVVALAVRQGPWEAAAGIEDAAMTTIAYEGSVLVQTHDAFTVAYAGTGLEVHGSDGSIVARDVMSQDPDGSILLRDARGERTVEPVHRRDLYESTLAAFRDAVAGHGSPMVDGAAGARALAVAIAARDSAKSRAVVPVAWDLP